MAELVGRYPDISDRDRSEILSFMRMEEGETIVSRRVRFRTLGCYPLSGAVESDAASVEDIIAEMLASSTSEREGRVIDKDGGSASMEKKKQEGYF